MKRAEHRVRIGCLMQVASNFKEKENPKWETVMNVADPLREMCTKSELKLWLLWKTPHRVLIVLSEPGKIEFDLGGNLMSDTEVLEEPKRMGKKVRTLGSHVYTDSLEHCDS